MRLTKLHKLASEWDDLGLVKLANPTETETHAVVDHTLTGAIAYGTKDELVQYFGEGIAP